MSVTLLWVVPLGLVIGLTLGALGGGGAILTVPILVYILGQDPKAATTGSLIIVGLTSLVGMLPHWRQNRVKVVEGVMFGVLGILGSFAGSKASAAVPAPVLMTSFAALMLIVAALMTRSRRADSGRAGATSEQAESHPAHQPEQESDHRTRKAIRVLLAATGVGLITGFFGVGGGFAVVPALVLALGFEMPTAVGTSLLVISINSATALASRVGNGVHVDWPLILAFSVFAAAGSLFGGRLAQKVDPKTLNVAFTVMLVLVAAFIAAQNVPQLLSSL